MKKALEDAKKKVKQALKAAASNVDHDTPVALSFAMQAALLLEGVKAVEKNMGMWSKDD